MASGTNSVDTSLNFDLNTIPLWLRDDEILEKELANDFNDAGMKFSSKEEAGGLMEELNKMSVENKKLSEMLMLMCESYNTLQSQMMELKSKNPDEVLNISRKRKAESDGNCNQNGTNGNMENSFSDEESCKKPREEFKTKISRAYVRTDPSDSSLIVKDGYQWRKYGQKVTRDNPCPRAYYKCSFAPSCPVKKKVQRSIDDQSILVATYEGEHNHPHSSQTTAMLNLTNGVTISSVPCLAPISSLSPSIPLDLIQPRPCHEVEKTNGEIDLSAFQQFLVDQMAFSLSKDPSFKAALATAISGRIQQLSPANNW